MGAWSSSLYGNDITCDVRDTYMKYLQDQLSNQEAYLKTIEMFNGIEETPDEAPLFWYALADTQWKTGRLMPEVKLKALEWIDKKGGMELWEESKSGGMGWQKTLNKLKEKLISEQPKEKKIRKPVLLNQDPWNLGDVYAYRFHTETAKNYGALNKYMILQKMGAEPNVGLNGETVMKVHVFDKLFDEIPTLDNLQGIRLLPFDYIPKKISPSGYVDPKPYEILHLNCWIQLMKKKDYPEDHLTYLGNMDIPFNKARGYEMWSAGYWDRIEEYWSEFFHIWQGVEYEVHEGVFKYSYPEQK